MYVVYVYVFESIFNINGGRFNKSIIYEIRFRGRSKRLQSAYLLPFFVRTNEGVRGGGINDPKEIKRVYTLYEQRTGYVYIFVQLRRSLQIHFDSIRFSFRNDFVIDHGTLITNTYLIQAQTRTFIVHTYS